VPAAELKTAGSSTFAAARFVAHGDEAQEIRDCVSWLQERLSGNPDARLMVVVAGLEARRGELERALLGSSKDTPVDYEFSMGMPLGQMGHARSALLLLRWLTSPLSEAEVDWLLGSGHCVANAREEQALAAAMLMVRKHGRERPSWRVSDFLSDLRADPQIDRRQHSSLASDASAASAWATRMAAAAELLQALPARQSPLDWVEAAQTLLQTAGWPGYHPLSSIGFQVCQRWQRVLEVCGSLGFEDRSQEMTWEEFATALAETVTDTVFAAESSDARVQITGPLESAGQITDGIWFLGVDESGWPGRGQPHPLLPIGLQRDAGMPHASPQADWNLAQEATMRLLVSAEEIVLSYAKQSAGIETRPSRLALRLLGSPEAIHSPAREPHQDHTETFADRSMVPFPLSTLRGGASVLTDQSNCAFKAFATSRLEADHWEPASSGLNAKQRGILLHSVLHRIWSGAARGGISSYAELIALPSPGEFVAKHVWRVMSESFEQSRRNSLPDHFPARYLELESERLTGLLTEWLEFERKRIPFTVAKTESKTEVTVAGLTMQLRIDRIDIASNSQVEQASLVIDYKSSEIGPKVWTGDRPESVQLPLYATFTEPEDGSDLEGLLVAQVRPGKMKFAGRLRDAGASLLPGLAKTNGLLRNPLDGKQLEEWRQIIERLGEEFVAGRAEVDPLDHRKTCERCHLHAVCRINENNLMDLLTDDEEAESSSEDSAVQGSADQRNTSQDHD
jgi:probable DNA repair protein